MQVQISNPFCRGTEKKRWHIDLSVDQGCKGQIVKEVCEIFPHVCVAVFPQALVIEAVHLCDLSALVVPTQYRDALWETDLSSQTHSNTQNTNRNARMRTA